MLPFSAVHAAAIVDYTFTALSPAPEIGAAISSIGFSGGPFIGGYTNWATGTEAGEPHALISGASGAGRSIDITLDATGYRDISLGGFFQLSAANTIAAIDWQLFYSTDGVNFNQIGSDFSILNVGGGNSENTRITVGANFSLPSSADDNPNVVFRLNSAPGSLTFDGGVPSGGQVRFDNFTINGDVIPEPSTALLSALGICGLLIRRRV
jgi:hypothetical protein